MRDTGNSFSVLRSVNTIYRWCWYCQCSKDSIRVSRSVRDTVSASLLQLSRWERVNKRMLNVRKKRYMTQNLVAPVRIDGIWRRGGAVAAGCLRILHTGEMSVEQNLDRNVVDYDEV